MLRSECIPKCQRELCVYFDDIQRPSAPSCHPSSRGLIRYARQMLVRRYGTSYACRHIISISIIIIRFMSYARRSIHAVIRSHVMHCWLCALRNFDSSIFKNPMDRPSAYENGINVIHNVVRSVHRQTRFGYKGASTILDKTERWRLEVRLLTKPKGRVCAFCSEYHAFLRIANKVRLTPG